jgi:DNA-binding beta-propeller fold protein YncE
MQRTTVGNRKSGSGVLVLAIAGLLAAGLAGSHAWAAEPFHSAYGVAYSPDGKFLAATDTTGGAVAILNAADGKIVKQVPLKGSPCSLAWAGNKLYVAQRGAFGVAEIDPEAGKVLRTIETGRYPVGLAAADKAKLLLVGDYGRNRVQIFDLESGKEKGSVETTSLPTGIAVNADQSVAAVTNLMPVGNATEATHSACLTLIDLKTLQKTADIKFTSGSTLMRGVVFSPDGKWAYVSHTLGRFTLPTTQLDRGWINTNALSVIDVANKQVYATVLLDRLTEGAADPWGLAIAKDGKTLWVTLSGVHQLGKLDLEKLHLLMDGKDLPKEDAPPPGMAPRHLSAIWAQIKQDPTKRALLANDLAALYGAGLLIRTKLDCNGPRGIDLAGDGKKLAVAGYFTGNVLLVDADTGKSAGTTELGKQPAETTIRRGDVIFHDATFAFQHWLSCATCHPDGARVDGLNWDLLNDGIGNPKNTRSLVWSPKTPPMMSLGVRANFDVASAAGFRFILFREPEPAELAAVKDYITSLDPDPSPFLTPDGKLSPKAQQGKAIFEDNKVGCQTCHPAPLYTDLKKYDVGTKGDLDRNDNVFYTPKLTELWRTAPYLHDGSAKDLREVIVDRNKKDVHGVTSKLTKEQVDALIEYLLSL